MAADLEITIRHATQQDAACLSRVGTSAFIEAYGELNDPQELAAHIESTYATEVVARELGLEGRRYLIAEVDGEAAGLGKLKTGPWPAWIPGVKAVEIHQLYVLEQFHRLGLGRRLVDGLLAQARQWGADGVWLSTWERATWAHAFYRKYGFEQVGTQVFTLGTEQQRDLLMYMVCPGEAGTPEDEC